MWRRIGFFLSNWSNCQDNPQDPLKDIVPQKDSYKITKSDALMFSFDSRTRNPRYVIERLDSRTSLGTPTKRPHFSHEESIDTEFRPDIDDYKVSGFDRGHLAPAADFKYSKETFKATFSMANISPQHPQINRGIWKELEQWTRDLLNTYDDILVISGPAFIPIVKQGDPTPRLIVETIGFSPHLIQVPTHFFKVIVARKKSPKKKSIETISCAAFLVPNSPLADILPVNYPLSPLSFLVKITDLEAVVGLKFFETFIANDFANLIDQSIIEPIPEESTFIPLSSHQKNVQRQSKLSQRSHFLFHESYTPSFLKSGDKENVTTKFLLNQISIRDQTHFVSRSENLPLIQLRHLCASCEAGNCSKLLQRVGSKKTNTVE